MTNKVEMLIVQYDSEYRFNLWWADKNGENHEYICAVIGLDNAVNAANAIAYGQTECVMYDFNERSTASVH